MKEDPAIYQNKDIGLKSVHFWCADFSFRCRKQLYRHLSLRYLALLQVEHAGPAVMLSFLLAAIVAGLSIYLCRNGCRYYVRVQPYSWVNVLLVNSFDGLCLSLLSEYFIAVAFVASGFSANLRGLVKPIGIELPSIIKSILVPMAVLSILLVAIVILLTVSLSFIMVELEGSTSGKRF